MHRTSSFWTPSCIRTLNLWTQLVPWHLQSLYFRRWRQVLSGELSDRTSCDVRGEPVLTPRNAVSVLNDLSPGGALMQGSRQEALAEHYPESVHRDLRQLYGSLSELLRHFWSCFVPMPPTTPAMQEKASKTYDTLTKFQMVKLRPFENELVSFAWKLIEKNIELSFAYDLI